MKKEKKGDSIAPNLVKFNNYKAKWNLLQRKKNLKDTKLGAVFINYDLTPKNLNLIKKARRLKKTKHIENAWTKNGRVYVKKERWKYSNN